jgi:hypothetical protein
VGFPDTYNIGKQFEFTYGNTERIKVTFDVEVQSYLPVIDEQNEFFGGNQISGYTTNTGTSFMGSTGNATDIIGKTIGNNQNYQTSTVNNTTLPTGNGSIPSIYTGSGLTESNTNQSNYTTPGSLSTSGNLDEASTSGNVNNNTSGNSGGGSKTNDGNNGGSSGGGSKTNDGEFDGNYWK